MIENEDSDVSSREVDFTLSFEKEVENEYQNQLEGPWKEGLEVSHDDNNNCNNKERKQNKN